MTRSALQKRAHSTLEIICCKQIASELGHSLVRGGGPAAVGARPRDRLRGGVRPRGSLGESARKRARGLIETVVGKHAIDDVPALECGRVVELTGHDQLSSAGGPGTL